MLALLVAAVCVASLAAPPARAAVPGAFGWSRVIKQPVTKYADSVSFTAPGPNGSLYVAGMYAVPLFTGDLWAGRVSPGGKTLWAHKYGRAQHVDTSIAAVAADSKGNLIVVGRGTYGTNTNVLVLKYSPGGKLLWARHYDGPAHGFDQATAVTVDPAGGIYVAAQVTRAATGVDASVLKYTAAGTLKWKAFVDGGGTAPNNTDFPWGIAVDAAHNTYVTGARMTSPAASFDAVTFKVSATGHPGWSQVVSTTHYDTGLRIVLRGGAVYVQGEYGSAGGGQLLLVKYNTSGGAQQWLKTGAGVAYPNAVGNALAVDGAGNVWVAGTSDATPSGRAMLARFAADGTFKWAVPYAAHGSDQSDSFAAIAIDGKGNAWVTGTEYDSSDFPHAITARYTFGSVRKWAHTWTGHASGYALGSSISLFGSGHVGVGGQTERPVTGWDPLVLEYRR